MLGGISTTHADRQGFGDRFRHTKQFRHGREGAAEVIGIETGDDYLLAAICKLASDIHQIEAEEIGFVYADDLGAPVEFLQNFLRSVDGLGFRPLIAVKDDFFRRIVIVDGGFEDLDAVPRYAGAAEAADELLAFP